MLVLAGSQGMNGCRRADQTQAGGSGRSLEEFAARTVNHGDTPVQFNSQPILSAPDFRTMDTN
jgi:hypothetical protein